MTWLSTVVDEGGENCRNCSTTDFPVWRKLEGREIEACPNCGDYAYDVYDFAAEDEYL